MSARHNRESRERNAQARRMRHLYPEPVVKPVRGPSRFQRFMAWLRS